MPSEVLYTRVSPEPKSFRWFIPNPESANGNSCEPIPTWEKKMYQRFENTAFISRPCLYKKVKGVGASIPSNGWKTRMTGTRRIIPSLGATQATLSMYRCISISETICSKIVASTPSRYFPTIRQITCTKAIVLSAPPSPSALASWLPWTLKVVLLLRPKMTSTWRLPLHETEVTRLDFPSEIFRSWKITGWRLESENGWQEISKDSIDSRPPIHPLFGSLPSSFGQTQISNKESKLAN